MICGQFIVCLLPLCASRRGLSINTSSGDASMPDNDYSLIEHEAQQMELIPSTDLPATMFAVGEAHGEFTGARLFSGRPEIYQAIVSLLAEGIGQLRVASITSTSVHTVRAVMQREGVAIDAERMRIAGDARSAARLCVDSILEALNDDARRTKMSPRDLGVLMGILVDKSELLSGRATSRAEVVVDVDVSDYRQMIDRAKELSADLQGDGFGGDNSPTKEIIDLDPADVEIVPALDPAAGDPAATGDTN